MNHDANYRLDSNHFSLNVPSQSVEQLVRPTFRKIRLTPAVRFFLLNTSALLVICGIAKTAHDENITFTDKLNTVQIIAPDVKPKTSQENVDLAMAMYGIQIPNDVDDPLYDDQLTDRGSTIKSQFAKNLVVKVGPAAFESWGILGSTLAHEINVHCQQNLLVIYLLDLMNLNGTAIAERTAYDYELEHADHFGLNTFDRSAISDTRDYYYPKTRNWVVSDLADLKQGIKQDIFSPFIARFVKSYKRPLNSKVTESSKRPL